MLADLETHIRRYGDRLLLKGLHSLKDHLLSAIYVAIDHVTMSESGCMQILNSAEFRHTYI